MRRLAWFAAALAAACGTTATPVDGPLDRVYFPTGLAVQDHRIIVASSNADLLFDPARGGSVLAIDPATDPAVVTGARNVASFAGDLAVADPAVCTSPTIGTKPLVITAMRGSNTLDVLEVENVSPNGGRLSDVQRDVALSGPFSEPVAVGVACGGGRSRAFVGHLRSTSGSGWITEVDLALGPTRGMLRHIPVGPGGVRALAYDASHDRLYVIQLATGTPTPLRWVELGGCRVGEPGAGGCAVGEATFPELAGGIELRSMALANEATSPRRAYLTGRRYDVSSASAAGGRTSDLGGVLLVVDLVENPFGGVDVRVVNEIDFGRGAQDVRVLPSRAPLRDGVVALAVDGAELLVYDDQTGGRAIIGRDVNGVPRLGEQPYGLAVDPQAVASVAHVYVGSFAQSFVSAIDVDLDDPDSIPTTATFRRISGGVR